MKIAQLKTLLKEADIPSFMFSLCGGLPNECYCLSHEDGEWIYYYSERGGRSDLHVFDDEDAACDFFHKRITRDLAGE